MTPTAQPTEPRTILLPPIGAEYEIAIGREMTPAALAQKIANTTDERLRDFAITHIEYLQKECGVIAFNFAVWDALLPILHDRGILVMQGTWNDAISFHVPILTHTHDQQNAAQRLETE